MAKLERIKFKSLGPEQECVGKSLIHWCHGKRMEIVKNDYLPGNAQEFYICRICYSIEIPYFAQLSGRNPENFFKNSNISVVKT
ncbi:MAG: hypothetical protein PVJ67_01890 [Candidatus Pacearchaeota archaeon]|jgi:hypothetical protein